MHENEDRRTAGWTCIVLPAVLATLVGVLGTATSALGDGPAPVITDPVPTLTISDARIAEGDAGPSHIVFDVRLSGPSWGPTTCRFTTLDGTARASDGDFESASGMVTFGALDTLATIDIVVQGDLLIEGNEWFEVRLSDPLGFAFADSEAVGTISNDERPTFTAQWVSFDTYTAGTLPASWADFNADGVLDLPLYTGLPGLNYIETSGFREVLEDGNYHGVSSCDYDRDGDLDVVLLGYKVGTRTTRNLLLQNQGDGTFLNVAPELGMAIAGHGETAVWADFNADGWPDLFAPYYTDRYPYQSFLYRNNGDGTFTERAAEAGISTPGVPWQFHPEGAHAADWDDDGDLDLYCASHLFINDGNGNFTDVREAVGLPAVFDEGCSFVDCDNDGDLDLYLRCHPAPRLFRNDSGHYTEITAAAGIGDVPWFWGDSWADADNDGDMDLVQHGGPARLLLNRGDGTFVRDPDFEAISSPEELSVWGDADDDGDLDVVIGPMGKQLMVNRLDLSPGFGASRFRVRVLDADGLETAYGATVRLRQLNGGPRPIQTRIVDGGSGYLGQNEYTVQFGGIGSGLYALEVVYPSPAGARVVVDSLVNPGLGYLRAGLYDNGEITVYRDGRVSFPPFNVAAVLTPPARPLGARVLGMPAPSPARRSVSIPVNLGRSARIALAIHDLRGRLLRSGDLGTMNSGPHSVSWDLRDDRGVPAATGVYFFQLLVDGAPADSRRILVLR